MQNAPANSEVTDTTDEAHEIRVVSWLKDNDFREESIKDFRPNPLPSEALEEDEEGDDLVPKDTSVPEPAEEVITVVPEVLEEKEKDPVIFPPVVVETLSKSPTGKTGSQTS